jgi:hypothetical protein
MKCFIVVAVFFLASSTVLAASPPESRKDNAGFEKLKSLVGTWNGTMGDGKKLTLTYKLVSNGSAVMEIHDSEEHKDGMITMYYLDGKKLMMTHYCSVGNQPRMKASALTSDGKLVFSFVDGTNMSPTDMHMHSLTITFNDAERITQDWTMRSAGKDQMHAVFELARSN